MSGHFLFNQSHPSNYKFHIPPTCKTCSPQSSIPSVSSSMASTLQLRISWSSSDLDVALDLKTYEVKRQVICPHTPKMQ